MTKYKKISLISAVILIAVILFFVHRHREATPVNTGLPTIPVRVQKPIQQSLKQTISATGYLIANKSATITPRASGYIKQIFFHEGKTVKTGDVLFQLDDQTEKDALDSAKAAADVSQLQYDRDKTFLKKGFITQDLFYSAKVTWEQNQATLKTAETNYAQRKIRAPFSGMLGSLAVSVGDFVNAGATLTTLVDNKHLRVEYALPVKYINQLKLNQVVQIKSATNKNTSTATVSYVSPAVNQATQNISVHARINNTAQQFKPGEYVSVAQDIGLQKNKLLVPEQSVMAAINGYSVFVAKNNKAIRVNVKIGEHINGNVVIMKGLKPTDDVIVAGQDNLKNNQPISEVPTGATQAPTKASAK